MTHTTSAGRPAHWGALVEDELLAAGYHSVLWNGTDNRGQQPASGIYLCRLTGGRTTLTRRLLLFK